MITMKFGGTSLATGEHLGRVAGIIAAQPGAVVVVVSAMGKTTNALLSAAQQAEADDGAALATSLDGLRQLHTAALPKGAEAAAARSEVEGLLDELARVLEGVRLLREQTPRSRALIGSAGERLSACLLAAHLRALDRPAEAVDARRFVVTAPAIYEEAPVELSPTRAAAQEVVAPLVSRGVVPVITGFIGATAAGITSTLGRGGSDYTAALAGALLGAVEIWIWTDVEGILTADPSLVTEARTLERVSYREAAEMSYFGARVLHPKTMAPAVAASIPIRIKSTFAPERPGTLVAEQAPTLPQGVKTVSSIAGMALVTLEGRGMAGVPGVARRAFEAAEAARVNVVMISQASSEQTITVVVAEQDASPLIAELERRFALELRAGVVDHVAAVRGVALLSIVGQGMAGRPGIAGKLFSTLGAVGVNVLAIAQGTSELNISVAVEQAAVQRAVRAVHSAFGLTRRINLVALGCGRVAGALLRQLDETRAGMESQLGLELRLVGLANSRRLLLDDEGLDPAAAVERLRAEGVERPDDAALVVALQARHLTDLVLVDLTAADTTDLQRGCLEVGIHVVTANKLPLSGSQADFDALTDAARKAGAGLNYETTFGAGLPVLHTLQELVNTGDRLVSITGCFSGTLRYICTRLEQGAGLAEAVAAAEREGLTEPDPREDLSGRDVARKALIIARTAGVPLEPEEVELEPLVQGLEGGLDAALAAHGAAIEEQVRELGRQGQVLRYVAAITPQRVRVGLEAVPADSPVGSLRGQDNILVYHTTRYNEIPLVIRGPGAGTEVTAAGVLGDVLKVARRGTE